MGKQALMNSPAFKYAIVGATPKGIQIPGIVPQYRNAAQVSRTCGLALFIECEYFELEFRVLFGIGAKHCPLHRHFARRARKERRIDPADLAASESLEKA